MRELVTGRIYGPSLFPQTLDTVNNAAKLGIPIIGSGGIWTKENADAMLSVGALAVQVDAALWNPANPFYHEGHARVKSKRFSFVTLVSFVVKFIFLAPTP